MSTLLELFLQAFLVEILPLLYGFQTIEQILQDDRRPSGDVHPSSNAMFNDATERLSGELLPEQGLSAHGRQEFDCVSMPAQCQCACSMRGCMLFE